MHRGDQRDREAVGSSSRLEARFRSRRGCQMRHFAGEWFARPQRHVPYSTLAIRSGNQYGLGFRYTQVLGRGIPLNASLEWAGRIRHDHKAVTRQTPAISKQKWQDYLSQHNTGVPFRWLTCRDYSTCIAHHCRRRNRRMDACHSQGQAPGGCCGYPSSACQRARPKPLVEAARFVGASRYDH